MAATCAKTAEPMIELLNGRHGVQKWHNRSRCSCGIVPRHDLFTDIADMNHGQMAVINIGANVSCAKTAEPIKMLGRLM